MSFDSLPLHTPALANTLAQELIISIFEINCISPSTFNPDYEELRRYALVSRTWSAAAQRVLFRRVSFPAPPHSLRSLAAFISAVDPSTEKGAWLGGLVRSLKIKTSEVKELELVTPADLVHATALCSNLFELEVIEEGRVQALDDVAFQTLTLMRNPPKALRAGWVSNATSIALLSQFLTAWPGLEFLTIHSYGQTWQQTNLTPQLSSCASPPRCALYALRLDIHDARAPELLSWLLHSSHDSLRSLAVQGTLSTFSLDGVLQRHGARLQSLALGRVMPVDLAPCPMLREFRLQHVMHIEHLECLHNLPPTIEHFHLGIFGAFPPQWVPLLDKGLQRMRALKSFTLQGVQDHHLSPQLRALAKRYRAAGIECRRVVGDEEAFVYGPREQSVHPSHFPRPMLSSVGVLEF